MKHIFKNSALLLVIVSFFLIPFTLHAGEAKHGLIAEFWNNVDYTGAPVFTKVDSVLQFDFGTGSVNSLVKVDTFGMQWSGQLVPDFSETYKLKLYHNDGGRLWIDGVLLIDKWGSGQTTDSATINLVAGKAYDLIVQIEELNNSTRGSLSWSSASVANEIIPKKNLFTGASGAIASPDSVVTLTGWVSGTTNAKVSGSNRLMTVMVMGESTSDFTATQVTYGGQTMTKQTENMYYTTSSRTYVAIFTLGESGVAAASSGTINVTWSVAPSSGSDVYSVLLGNVDQTNPVSAKVNNALTDTIVATTSPLLANKGDMVIMAGATGTNNTITFYNNFIKMFESNSSWGDGVGGYKMGSGASETPSFSQSASGRIVICAIVAKLSGSPTAVNDKNENILPTSFELLQNYPNPFNPTTNINFSIQQSGLVTLKVFNILGQEVATLVNQNMQPGKYSVDFNASKLSSGVFIYQLTAGTYTSTKKMMLLK